jgi:hypothetical protein
MPDSSKDIDVEDDSPAAAEDAVTPTQHIIEMASSVEDDYEDEISEKAEMTSVLDLKKYEISQAPQPDPVIKYESEDDSSDISDFVNRTREEDTESESEDDTEATESKVDTLQTELDGPSSATQIWADVLAANPVESVPDLLAAFTRFIETLDQNGMIISVPAHDVDMVAEEGETSRLRMHG